MAKTRIAVLGGGLGSLTTAYELTRTPELRDRYEVTVYQMGWRLGGKGATGRNQDPEKGQRIEEHGLHIWLGFYENAFALIQEAYDELGKEGLAPHSPIKTWRDAFKPQSFTPVGLGDGETYLPVTWPTNSDVPGEGGVFLSPRGAVTQVLSLLKILLSAGLKEVDHLLSPAGIIHLMGWMIRVLLRSAKGLFSGIRSHGPVKAFKQAGALAGLLWSVRPRWGGHGGEQLEKLVDHAHGRAQAFEGAGEGGADREEAHEHVHFIAHILEAARDLFHSLFGHLTGEHRLLGLLLEMLEMALAIFRGFLNPKYGLLKDFDLNRIDDYEFMDWLVENGAPESMRGLMKKPQLWAPRNPFLRALYDLAFAYEQRHDEVEGEKMYPNFAAGAALRCIFRIVGTYKEAVLFEMQAGMGEVVVTPVYLLLKNRGVNFEFFSKITDLELSENRNWIQRVKLEQQAKVDPTKVPSGAYQPTLDVDGLTCWPSEPFWDQLVDGEALRGAGVNFESNWCKYPEGYAPHSKHLELGTDFDQVVLGISLGGFKDFGNGDGSICQELMEASGPFREMVEQIGVVPTHAEQFWMTRDLEGLGWTLPRPAMVGAVEPLDVWADMTRAIDREAWPKENRPQSLHYLCGPLNTDLFRRSSKDGVVPQDALGEVRDLTRYWLENFTDAIWPDAVDPPGSGSIDWSLLYGGRESGPARLDFQYLRANVDPTECCVATWAGSTKYRLSPGESGFLNLILAGTWTRTGMNTACVEGAVMSGMEAARAISGSPRTIVGENFMQGKAK